MPLLLLLATPLRSPCLANENCVIRYGTTELYVITGTLLPIKPTGSGHRVKRLDPVPNHAIT